VFRLSVLIPRARSASELLYLNLQAAICLQPLTLAQIDRYLNSAGTQLTVVRQVLRSDSTLQDLAQSPLMLSIITLAYQGISLDELPQRSGLDDWHQHLFDRYIQRMFKRRRGQGKYSQDTLIFGLIGVFTMAVLGQMVGVPILFGAVIGLLFGLFSPAGIACIQHFMLRLVLYCSGCIL
jgi:hypothetical protein